MPPYEHPIEKHNVCYCFSYKTANLKQRALIRFKFLLYFIGILFKCPFFRSKCIMLFKFYFLHENVIAQDSWFASGRLILAFSSFILFFLCLVDYIANS